MQSTAVDPGYKDLILASNGRGERDRRDATDHPGARLSTVPPFVRQVLRENGGQPLVKSLRAPVERREDVDLSHVRIHEDGKANAACANAGALAFAHGPDIYLSAGATTGRPHRDALITHELMHVADQAGGPPVIQRFPNQSQAGSAADLVAIVRTVEATQPPGTTARQTLAAVTAYVHARHGGLSGFRYFETVRYGWIDIKHFCTAADYAASAGEVLVDILGFGNEVAQWLSEWGSDYRSGFSAEDIPSNSAGSNFGDDVLVPDGQLLSAQLEAYLVHDLAAVDLSNSTTLTTLPTSDQGGAIDSGQLGMSSDNPFAHDDDTAPVADTAVAYRMEMERILDIVDGRLGSDRSGVPTDEECRRADEAARATTGYTGPPLTLHELLGAPAQ